MNKLRLLGIVLVAATLSSTFVGAGEVKLGVVLDARRPGCEIPETAVKLTNGSSNWYRATVEAYADNSLDLGYCPGGAPCKTSTSQVVEIAPGATVSAALSPFPTGPCGNACDNHPGEPQFCARFTGAKVTVTHTRRPGGEWSVLSEPVTVCNGVGDPEIGEDPPKCVEQVCCCNGTCPPTGGACNTPSGPGECS